MLNQELMYLGKANSPATTLTTDITDSQTEITITSTDILATLNSGQLVTIGQGDSSETVYYTSVNGTTLTGCIRGYGGTSASAWDAGTTVWRVWTAEDYRRVISNIEDIASWANTRDLSTQSLSYSQDEERRNYVDDFSYYYSSNNYDVSGTVTGWGTGSLSFAADAAASIVTTDLPENTGFVDVVVGFGSIPTTGDFVDIPLGENGFKIRIHNTVYFADVSGSLHTGVVHGITNVSNPFILRAMVMGGLGYFWINNNLILNGVNIGDNEITTAGLSQTSDVTTITTLYKISSQPTRSDYDDCSADGSVNWAVVDGTSFTFDTDHYNILTDGSAGKIRKKYYVNEEGYHKIQTILPTGSDGDLISLVIGSDSGNLSDGAGVGLMSDGAGNWNFASISDTVVTEGADSGLDDGDTVIIELERFRTVSADNVDYQGKLLGWIYDPSVSKSTDPDVNIYTNKNSGYSGLYCLGNSKTFPIYDWEVRTNTKVCNSNIVSETDYYFNDIFYNDTRGRYGGEAHTLYDSVNDVIYNSTSSATCPLPVKLSNSFELEHLFKFENNGSTDDFCRASFPVLIQSEKYSSLPPFEMMGTSIYCASFGDSGTSGSFIRFYLDNVNVSQVDDIFGFGNYYKVKTVYDGTTYSVYHVLSDAAGSGTYPETPTLTYEDSTYSSGYTGIGFYQGETSDVIWYKKITVDGKILVPTEMRRGARSGLYRDGSENVICTAYSDDCEQDNSGKWNDLSSSSYDLPNKRLTLADTSKITLKNLSFGEGYYQIYIQRSAASGTMDIYLGDNYITINNDGLFSINGDTTDLDYLDVPSSIIKIGIIVTNTSIEVFSNDVSKGIKTGLTVGYDSFGVSRTVADWYIYGTYIDALEENSPNGISYLLPSLSEGGRTYVGDSVTKSIVMTDIINSRLSVTMMTGKAIDDSGTVEYNVTMKNATDDTIINSDPDNETKVWANAPSQNYLHEYTDEIMTRWEDKDDTIIVSVSTDEPQDCGIYHAYTMIKPFSIIEEGDLL